MLAGTGGDPYAARLEAGETDLRAVVVGGVARYGTPRLLEAEAGLVAVRVEVHAGEAANRDVRGVTSHVCSL